MQESRAWCPTLWTTDCPDITLLISSLETGSFVADLITLVANKTSSSGRKENRTKLKFRIWSPWKKKIYSCDPACKHATEAFYNLYFDFELNIETSEQWDTTENAAGIGSVLKVKNKQTKKKQHKIN